MSDQSLPRWEMPSVFPGLDSTELDRAIRDASIHIDSLSKRLDSLSPNDPGPELVENVLVQFDQALDDVYLAEAYVLCYVVIDTINESAQEKLDAVNRLQSTLQDLTGRFVRWIGVIDIDRVAIRSVVVQEHLPVLRYLRARSRHLMSPEEESLATELTLSGGVAWSRFYGSLSAQITMDITIDGNRETVPVSGSQRFAAHPDRELRRRTYEAEIAAWESNAIPPAAALNGIKDTFNVLSRRRGWPSPLEQSLFENRIDRQTLDMMYEAVRSSFPDFRRYLLTKATLLGVSQLAWYDLYAPVGDEDMGWTYPEACQFVIDQLGSYSEQFGNLAQRAFDERWIDAEPRAGKRGGGLAIPLQQGETRIMLNFSPSLSGMRQMAHELGHAYHYWLMDQAGRTMLQKFWTPWTMAETASIFAETIVRKAMLNGTQAGNKLAMLDASLQQVRRILDHYCAFRFEQYVFERRKQRELSVTEFNELMLDAQREAYGPALDPDSLHPYMWAMLPHFYIVESSFNNYPYTFGLLFSPGLYAESERDPDRFRSTFDEMLTLTGMLDVPELAGRFGIDLRDPSFWHRSVNIIRQEIDQFEALASQIVQGH